MKRVWQFFSRQGIACLGVGLFAVCALIVFFPALPKFMGLASPDAPPYFIFAYSTSVIEGLLTGAAVTPHTLYWLLFDPLYAHELTYIIDSLVLALAGVYYLSGRRVHPLAAWTGGLALGLSGYTFTLFSAGHRGYFHMFSCAVWAFGLLIRCFETRKLFYFAMLGLVIAWGVPYQPDVLVLVMAVAAAYALWLTFLRRKAAVQCILSVWPRFLVSVAVLFLAGFGGLRSAVTTQITNRDAQISGASAQEAKADKKPEKVSEAEKHNRWLFATNWSLPPEDMLEFIVPGVFGDESMQMPYPYWGRLGRPSEEVFQKGRMMPNYRQHTVYLGVVPVLLALFGVMAWFSQRREKDVPSLQTAADTSDVPFWCVVWAVCLLLAMGRYAPLYKLFYSIPYMDYIRAPVKFHHLVEMATAFLAGFGMDAFVRAAPGASGLRRRLVGLGVGVTGVLLVGALTALVAKPQIARHVAELGMGQAAAELGGYAVQNVMRSACLAAAVAALAYAAFKGSQRMAVRYGCVLLAVLAVEQAWVASRYVRVIDVEPLYNENAVVRAIEKAAKGQMVNVVNYVTPNEWGRDWFSSSLVINGINNVTPAAGDNETPMGRLFKGLQGDPVRLWRVVHAQYVIVPRKSAEGLVRAGVLRPALDFEFGAGQLRQTQPGEKTVLLAEVCDHVKTPQLVSAWKGSVPVGKQAEAVIDTKETVSDAPPQGSASAGTAEGQVKTVSTRGLPGVFATRLEVSLKMPELLIFNERYSDQLEVSVDGRTVPVYTADALWASVRLPEGNHRVVLRKKPSSVPFALSASVSLGMICWGLLFFFRNGKKSEG